MNWINLALTVMTFIIKYGPKLWNLGVEAYHMVEEMKAEWKRNHPDKDEVEAKNFADSKFAEEVKVKAEAVPGLKVPADVTVTQLRRDVWSTRPENYKKVVKGRPGGRKPT